MPLLAVQFATIALGVALVALLVAVVALYRSRRTSNDWRSDVESDWRRRLQTTCRDAFAFVDLATGTNSAEARTTAKISALRERVEQIDARLQTLQRGAEDDRTREAIEEMHLVAVSVAAALEAERSARVDSDGEGSDWTRVAERTAELDLATREVSLLVDSSL